MSQEELSALEGFEIRSMHGKVRWNSPVDIRGLDLDAIVTIKPGGINLYPNAKHKPIWGRGLHTNCQIMLFNCWPKGYDATRLPSKERSERFASKLEKFCE